MAVGGIDERLCEKGQEREEPASKVSMRSSGALAPDRTTEPIS